MNIEHAYQLVVRATLVASAILLFVAVATALSLGAPTMVMWAILAATVGIYARHRLLVINSRRAPAQSGRHSQTKSSAMSN